MVTGLAADSGPAGPADGGLSVALALLAATSGAGYWGAVVGRDRGSVLSPPTTWVSTWPGWPWCPGPTWPGLKSPWRCSTGWTWWCSVPRSLPARPWPAGLAARARDRRSVLVVVRDGTPGPSLPMSA